MSEMDKSQKAVAIDGGIIGIDDLKISLFRLFRGGGADAAAGAGAPNAGAGQQPSQQPSGDAAGQANKVLLEPVLLQADQAVLLPFQLAFQP